MILKIIINQNLFSTYKTRIKHKIISNKLELRESNKKVEKINISQINEYEKWSNLLDEFITIKVWVKKKLLSIIFYDIDLSPPSDETAASQMKKSSLKMVKISRK